MCNDTKLYNIMGHSSHLGVRMEKGSERERAMRTKCISSPTLCYEEQLGGSRGLISVPLYCIPNLIDQSLTLIHENCWEDLFIFFWGAIKNLKVLTCWRLTQIVAITEIKENFKHCEGARESKVTSDNPIGSVTSTVWVRMCHGANSSFPWTFLACGGSESICRAPFNKLFINCRSNTRQC